MKNNNENSTLLLIAFLMTFSVSLASIQYVDLDYKQHIGVFAIFLMSFIFSYLCKLLFKNIISFVVSLGIFLATLLSLYFIKFYNSLNSDNLKDFFVFLKTFIFKWYVGMEKPALYQKILIIAIVVLISMIMHLSIYKFKKSFIAVILATFIFFAQWAFIHEIQLLAFYIYLPTVFLIYIISIYKAHISRINKEEQKSLSSKRSLVIMVTPLLFITMFFMFLLPLNKGPISISWLDKIIKESTFNTHIMKYDVFSLARSGFSTENGNLNSNVHLDNTEVLNVYGKTPLYLKGAVYDTYTDNRWLQTIEKIQPSYSDISNSRVIALKELYYGSTLLYMSSYINKTKGLNYYENPLLIYSLLANETTRGIYNMNSLFFKYNTATIVYKNLKTKSVFMPPYSKLMIPSNFQNILVNKDEVFTSVNPLSRGERILIEYLDINQSLPNVKLLLNLSKEGFYYDMNNYLDDYAKIMQNSSYLIKPSDSSSFYNPNTSSKINYKDFNKTYKLYKNELQDLMKEAHNNVSNYTSLSRDISPRVKQLAYDITANYKTNYEKVKAIETYFQYEFTYTLTPTPLPSNQEFVDFFLFESKEGYCSSYATAMTILVRSLGIPARYVEGYVMPNKTISPNVFSVRNSNAHAWVEVYFEGFGWVTFEPTFVFSYITNKSFNGNSTLDKDLIKNNKYNEYVINIIDEDALEAFDPTIDSDYTITPPATPVSTPFNYQLLIILLIGILLFLNILIRRIIIYRFKHVKNNTQYKKRYMHLLKILTLLKYEHLSYQTLDEYASTIDEIFKFGNISFKDITNIYSKIIYSDYLITPTNSKQFASFYKLYLTTLKEDIDFIDYFIIRYLFPII